MENDISYRNSEKYKCAYFDIDHYINKGIDKHSPYEVLVMGAGYVGYALSIAFGLYNHVSVIDINVNKVNKINNKESIFNDSLIDYYLNNKELSIKAYLPNQELYKDKDFIIIALPTDYNENKKTINTDLVRTTIEDIRKINKKCLIVIKSTCHIGFSDSLNDKHLIYCPEFLKEGKALEDELNPSRIIIGGDKNDKRVKTFTNLLLEFSKNNPQVVYMSKREAEAVKLFSNAYLAMRVAYFNELDTYMINKNLRTPLVIQGVSLDPRIGDYYNNPSFGYGGYCLPKDTSELATSFIDIPSQLISAVIDSNRIRKEFIANEIMNKVNKDDVIGIYRLVMKSGSDNYRQSSIIDVVNCLKIEGYHIIIYEPLIKDDLFLNCEVTNDISKFKNRSDIVIANRWDDSLNDIKYKVYSRDLSHRD